MALADAVPSAVAAYTLDEASGTRFDSVGSNDLTDNNTVGSDTGKFGNAADFEASSLEYLSTTDTADLSSGDVKLTLRCWVRLESKTGKQGIVLKGDSSFYEYGLFYDSSTDRFTMEANSASSGFGGKTTVSADNFGSPSTGTWYLLHGWHDPDANEVGIAVNAGTADTASHAGGMNDTTAPFVIGSFPSFGENFDGLIDDAVVLKGYLLDADERTEDYNGGTGVAFADWPGGLDNAVPYATAHWPLSESSGTRVDSVGSLDLTDNNSVGSDTGKFGNAADFEASSSQYLEHADDAILDLGDRDFMFRCWIKAESLSGFPIVFRKRSLGHPTAHNAYALYCDGTSLRWNLFGTEAAWGSALSTGTWYLVHAWHDAANNRIGISVNGGTAVTTSYSDGVVDSTGVFQVGASTSQGLYWDGLIEDLVLLDGYLLSHGQRVLDYNGGTGVAFADWAGGGGGGLAVPIAAYHYRQLAGAG